MPVEFEAGYSASISRRRSCILIVNGLFWLKRYFGLPRWDRRYGHFEKMFGMPPSVETSRKKNRWPQACGDVYFRWQRLSGFLGSPPNASNYKKKNRTFYFCFFFNRKEQPNTDGMNSTWNNNPLATLTPRKTFVEYDQCRVYTITPPRVKIILQPHKTFLPLHIHFINEQKKNNCGYFKYLPTV